MREADIPQVLEIDLDAFPSQWPHPTINSFHHELRNKLAHYLVICRDRPAQQEPAPQAPARGGLIYYLKKLLDHGGFFGRGNASAQGDCLVGMAGIWMMVDEAHIVTIAVRNTHRQHGLGEWLLIAVIELATQLRAKYVTLEVRMSNTVAQTLYDKYGFGRAGVRKRYYSDNGEDALIMSTSDITLASYQSRFQQLKQEHAARWINCLAVT